MVCAVSCNSGRVRISGRIEGADGARLTCERVRFGRHRAADTLRLSGDGRFAFAFALPKGAQDFFQLQLDTLPPLLLLMEAGGRAVIEADAADFAATLAAEGSPEMTDLAALQKQLWANNRRLDSLLRFAADNGAARRGASQIFVEQKRLNTTFIMKHLGRLSGAAAYYQRLGGSLALFGYADDRFLLARMLDSLRRAHPKSPYTAALERDLDKLNGEAQRQMLQQRIEASPVVSKPEIALPDADGRVRSLAALTGNVTLLQFWSAGQPSSILDNRELLNLHREFGARRFRIYQVALDTDSALWRREVRRQGLLWASVCSFEGLACRSALAYNVSGLPSNFLINKKGEIVAKNLFDEDLRNKISQLLTE